MHRPDFLLDLEVDDEAEEDLSRCLNWANILKWTTVGYLCILMIIFTFPGPPLLSLGLFSLFIKQDPAPFLAFSEGTEQFEKPKGFKIVAVVPFREHERTAILDCYLQRNLAHNHGFLDQVVFIPETANAESLDWLVSIVEQTPAYTISRHSIIEKDVMYVHIDGDVVFLEDHAIPTIVKTKLDHADSLMVSANVINQAAIGDLHRSGVALPYLPELYHVTQPYSKHDWRVSSLPPWEGPEDFKLPKDLSPPFKGHRWLLSTDVATSRVFGPEWARWAVSAQQHYSFLHHLEANDLRRYKFPLWTDSTEPVSSNFISFWGKDEMEVQRYFRDSPENHVSVLMRDAKVSHAIIDGKGLVSHYPADAGAEGLDSTDILERYRLYAQEMICLYTY